MTTPILNIKLPISQLSDSQKNREERENDLFSTVPYLGSGKSPGTRTCDKLNPKPVQVTASNSDFARDHHRETSFFVIPTPDPTPDKTGGLLGRKV